MKNTFAALLLVTSSVAAIAQGKPIKLAIAAGQVGEICMPLQAGETLSWRFLASATADFNLHHHVGQQVLTPVLRKAVKQGRGRHTAERSNDWCLMWTAPARQDITVNGAWRVRKPGSK